MATIGPVKAFTVTIAAQATTAAVLSSEVDLGGGYNHYSLIIPSMTSGGDIGIYAAEKTGGTFRKVYLGQSLTSAPVAFNVISSISNCMVPIPAGYQFCKVYMTTAATSAGNTFYIIATAN